LQTGASSASPAHTIGYRSASFGLARTLDFASLPMLRSHRQRSESTAASPGMGMGGWPWWARRVRVDHQGGAGNRAASPFWKGVVE